MVYEQLKKGKADIGFMAINNSGDPLPDLRKKPLTELPISLVFPAWHPLVRKKDLKIEDLANCNFILPPAEQMPWLRKYIDNFFQEHCGKIPQAEQDHEHPAHHQTSFPSQLVRFLHQDTELFF